MGRDGQGRVPGVDLEEVMLAEVNRRVDRWRRRYAGRRDAERVRLLLLALEREQVVSVAYREEAVAGRVAELDASEDFKGLVRQALVWIWKDEQLHSEYLRGRLLAQDSGLSHAVAYAYQLQGALSGLASAAANHRDPSRAPLRAGIAGALIAVGRLTGQVSAELKPELTFQSLHRYFRLSVALEGSAALGYVRFAEVAQDGEEAEAIQAIHSDEVRHISTFRLLADAVTETGRPAPGMTPERLRDELVAVSPFLVPASQRSSASGRRSFGSRAVVAVRQGSGAAEKETVLRACLDAAGLGTLARGRRRAAVRVSFMLGYDRRDRSNVNDPQLVASVADYLKEHGVDEVAVLEAPTVYGRWFGHRSVEEVATYFGFSDPSYRLVDISQDLRPYRFDRGFVQHGISGTWLDADLRIVMPKLRTDPTEFAHLSLSTLEGSTGSIPDTFYAGRSIDFRSATMTLLDVAPPDFAVVDAWGPVADGPFGVMGCNHPAYPYVIYAGADTLAVDETVLADLGVDDPRAAPIVRTAYHWFGPPTGVAPVDGARPDLRRQLRGVHASRLWRMMGQVSYPVYMFASEGGKRFVPPMDPAAFPETSPASALTRLTRRSAQRAFGIAPR